MSSLVMPCVKAADDIDSEETINRLAAAVANGGVTPFVGAGISHQNGLPLWKDFINDVRGHLGLNSDKLLEDLINSNNLEDAAAYMEEKAGTAFNQRVEFAFGGRKTELIQPTGAIRCLPELAGAGPVITTNFDDLLLAVFAEQGEPLRELYAEEIAAIIGSFHRRQRNLIRLHGKATSRYRVLTRKEYKEHYGISRRKVDLKKPIPMLILSMALMRPFLFLGCSLQNDWTMDVLRMIAQYLKLRTAPEHFAIMRWPGEDNARERQRLIECGIQPIWFNNFGDIESLLKNALERARRRQNKPLHVYWGMEEALRSDSVFQDFATDQCPVKMMWADVNSPEEQRCCSVSARIEKENGNSRHLHVFFSSTGNYPSTITIRPTDRQAINNARAPHGLARQYLSIQVRVPQAQREPVYLAFRVIDSHLTFWWYGSPCHTIHRHATVQIKNMEWKPVVLDLGADCWHRFEEDGNHLVHREAKPDFSVLVGVTILFGRDKKGDYPNGGAGAIEIGTISLSEDPPPHAECLIPVWL